MNTEAKPAAKEDWDIILRPRRKWFSADVRGVWEYRDLIMLFVRRDFVAQYKQTILGPAWMLVQPLVTTILYALIFGRIAKLPTGNIPPGLFIITGLVSWGYFSDCIGRTSSTFTGNASIFGKVYFPRLVTPVSVVISNLYKFSIQLMLTIMLLLYYHFYKGVKIEINYHIIYIPLLMVILAGMGLSAGLIVSSMTVRYRDMSFLIGFITQFLMYGSSVIISFHTFGPKIESILRWNPMVWIVEAFRYALVGTGVWSWNGILYSFCWMILLLVVAITLFGKVEKTFMDTV